MGDGVVIRFADFLDAEEGVPEGAGAAVSVVDRRNGVQEFLVVAVEGDRSGVVACVSMGSLRLPVR